jgi:hypothetical protein
MFREEMKIVEEVPIKGLVKTKCEIAVFGIKNRFQMAVEIA